MLLPLNDLQGEVHGIAGANVLTDQLQTGQIDTPNLLSEVKDSGAIDVTLEESVQGDGSTIDIQDNNCQAGDSEHSDARRHQGTQTELCLIPMADFVVPESTCGHIRGNCEYNSQNYQV